MREREKGSSPDPVPVRVKISCIIMSTLLMAASAAVGAYFSGEDISAAEIPVVLADGSVIKQPWYIEVDGQRIAVVRTEEDADMVLEELIDKYSSGTGEDTACVAADDRASVLDIELKENVSVGRMELKNGDSSPDILDRQEAGEKIETGDDGDSMITVVVTEEKTEDEKIDYDREYKADDTLYTGQTRVETEGRAGEKEVRKKIVMENGKTVKEEILEENIVKEPEDEIILTGTRDIGGADGASSGTDEGVSRDTSATYSPLMMPVDDVYVSSGFGTRWGRLHRGVDLALAQGSPIYAADSGTVYFAGDGGGYGNLVKVDHGNGMQTYYAHCSSLLVTSGQKVSRGEKIALTGSTGNSTGPHLHFEVIINGKCIDPAGMLGL
ncbi:MAG: peptidoglycan DD-metalloendopeptidase family protein [Clostridiales bacterium]|nr:peptidoglycan DD-metalloendopeptidase family protein [Clostridiales bacterium]